MKPTMKPDVRIMEVSPITRPALGAILMGKSSYEVVMFFSKDA